MKVIKCSDEVYAKVADHASRMNVTLARALDELVTCSPTSLNNRFDRVESALCAILQLIGYLHLDPDSNKDAGANWVDTIKEHPWLAELGEKKGYW